MSEEIIYPLEASKGGKNAYYHHCENRGHSANYAVCLNTLAALDEGRLKEDQFTDCQAACKAGTCNARSMRRQEVDAGRSLFYKERTNINPANTRSAKEAQENALVASSGKYDLTNASFARGWAQVGAALGKDKPATPASKPAHAASKPIEKPSGYVEQDFSKLVNAIASEKPIEKPVTATQPVAHIDKPMPGETPLQFARRRAAMKG